MPPSPVPACTALLPDRLLHADYRWELDGQWRALRIGTPAPDLEDAFPDARRFGLLSAAKPGWANANGHAPVADADRALQRTLDGLGLRHRPACAMSGNRTWKLYGWLVLDPDTFAFDHLTRSFGQAGALLWARGQAVRLRIAGARPPDTPSHASIDWIAPSPSTDAAIAAASP